MADGNDGRRALRFVVTGALLLSPAALGCGGEETINEPMPVEAVNEPLEQETVNEPEPEPEPTVNEPAPEPAPPAEEPAPEQ